MIAEPEYEWERQWISPDGSKTAYPIHVNESPQFFESKNKDKVLIYYCASGSWTPYYCIGLLTADAGSDLTNAASWKKQDTPVFEQQPEDSVFGPGSPSFVPTPDEKEWYMLYHARKIPNDAPGATDSRSPRLQKISCWENLAKKERKLNSTIRSIYCIHSYTSPLCQYPLYSFSIN